MNLVSLGIDFGVLNAINLWVAAALPGKDGQPQLWAMVFHEARPDLGEVKLVSRTPGTRLAANASQVMVPWANYDRMESLWLWHAWLEGDALCASPSTSAPPARLSLSAAPASLVYPALTVASGELDIAFVAAGGKELALARFTPGPDGSSAKGSILWRHALDATPIACRAALSTDERHPLRRSVLVRQEKGEVLLQLVDLENGRAAPGASNARIPGYFALPSAEPGIRIDQQGTTYVSLLLAANPELTDLSVADISFPAAKDERPTPRIEKARKVAVAPVAAGVTFQSRPDRPMRRDWVLLLPDGSLVHNLSSDKPMRPQGKPVTPLSLVALSQATYILTLRADGPFLEALR